MFMHNCWNYVTFMSQSTYEGCGSVGALVIAVVPLLDYREYWGHGSLRVLGVCAFVNYGSLVATGSWEFGAGGHLGVGSWGHLGVGSFGVWGFVSMEVSRVWEFGRLWEFGCVGVQAVIPVPNWEPFRSAPNWQPFRANPFRDVYISVPFQE
jgi:hypothetical protein